MNSLLTSWFVLMGLCLGAVAQEATSTADPAKPAQSKETTPATSEGRLPDGTYRIGKGVTPPRAISAPDPQYSDQARKAGLVGIVTMWLVVDSEGKPQNVHVSRHLGMGLDEAAVAAVQTWRFQPAEKAGIPVPVRIMVEVQFRMYPPLVPETVTSLGPTGDQPLQLPLVDSSRYPLTVNVGSVTGQHVAKGYVVSAEATIREGTEQRKVTLSCGPKGTCFLVNFGRYPARWLNDKQQIELLGGKDKKLQKAQFSVAAGGSSTAP
jgi:TonB family protein